MKIYTDGAKHLQGQLPRIEAGFVSLGHEITPYIDEADLLYSNNPPFDQLIKDKFGNRLPGKVILTVLDLPRHIVDFNYEKLGHHLHQADAICTISHFVQGQVKETFGLDSTVIYQPIKEVVRVREKKHPFRFLFCGRVNDRMKRTTLGAQAISILGYGENDVVTVGSDFPHYGGQYFGVVTDEVLNELYNSVDFVVVPSAFEGLGLPGIECVAAGAIPVVANDHPTFFEFFPLDVFPEYADAHPNPASLAAFMARFLNNDAAMEEFKNRLHSHYLANWAGKLSGRGVAESILKVYESIT